MIRKPAASLSTRVRHDLGPGPTPALTRGAVVLHDGVQFILFSRHATAVSVLLYDDPRRDPTEEIILDPAKCRHGDLWSVFVPGIAEGQIYAFRVDGPDQPAKGHRFDPSIPLLDPYARATTSNTQSPRRTRSPFQGTNADRPKCIAVRDDFDWQGDAPLNRPLADAVIYEAHLRGLTAHPSSGARYPGTFRGLIDKIPYLKELGITAVELLPVFQFYALDAPGGLVNY